MIKDVRKLRRFEREFLTRETIDIDRNFRIVDALYDEAVSLGVIPPKAILDGLETKIKISRVINSVSKHT